MDRLTISLIIPAVNEADCIKRAVESGWASGVDQVVVVDGGSEDKTRDLANQANATVLTSQRGRARQQNAGAEAATGDVLLFHHADNWFAEGAAEQIRSALADQRIDGGAFRQFIVDPRWRFRVLEWGNAMRAKWRRLPYGDQAIFIRRDVFTDLGKFPDVPLMEDFLLMREFRRRRHRLVLLPGPHFVNARRWVRHGVVRQTLRNWGLIARFWLGTSPEKLARHYRPHDANPQ